LEWQFDALQDYAEAWPKTARRGGIQYPSLSFKQKQICVNFLPAQNYFPLSDSVMPVTSGDANCLTWTVQIEK
jgi:hypothetical protein